MFNLVVKLLCSSRGEPTLSSRGSTTTHHGERRPLHEGLLPSSVVRAQVARHHDHHPLLPLLEDVPNLLTQADALVK